MVRTRGRRTGRRRGQAQKGPPPPARGWCSATTVVQRLQRARGTRHAMVRTGDAPTTLSREPVLQARRCPAWTAWRWWSGPSLPRFLSLRRRHLLRPSSPKVKYAATDPGAPTASGRIWFVPSITTQSSVSSVPDAEAAGTNLKRNTSKTKDGLCDRIQLECVNPLLVSIRETDLCEDSPVFNSLVHNPLCRCIHHWRVSL